MVTEQRLRGHSPVGALEVIPAVITAVTTTIVSFLPVFFLTGRDHRLFAPLAWTKTFALASSLIVAVVVVPMLCRVLLRSSRITSFRHRVCSAALGLGRDCSTSVTDRMSCGASHLSGNVLGLPKSVLMRSAALLIGALIGWWIVCRTSPSRLTKTR